MVDAILYFGIFIAALISLQILIRVLRYLTRFNIARVLLTVIYYFSLLINFEFIRLCLLIVCSKEVQSEFKYEQDKEAIGKTINIYRSQVKKIFYEDKEKFIGKTL